MTAQSNDGVDAVFENVVKWAGKNRPQWIEEGVLCRVGASTVDESLFKELNRHWDEADDDDEDNFDGLISSISTSNIPDCSAYKMAKYARSNPTEESCPAYIKYADARVKKKRRFQTGQPKVSGATTSRGSAIRELMKA
ncbi:uncharacterized protein J4E78_010613 [Alternaria triticimaculans]|uniref:uncharacterized protein n=1 Tax=Alternaria triticimaculans TaxID=297637 RepID=UPI0020C281A6|nr:uncharacterized protein J4E78_010613 [Alternaria triticimaculans]KAI4640590.1 hypothetical protein J4E78_010613 [Alternaria triticimaculans]